MTDENLEFLNASTLKTALQAGAALGDTKPAPTTQHEPYVIVPEGHEINPLPPLRSPPRKTGTVTAHDVESFIEYVQRHASDDTVIYGSQNPARFIAVLNDHAKTQVDDFTSDASNEEDVRGARWRDFRCCYPLVHSREWTTWMEKNRKPFPNNKDFAEWLEDNLVDIVEPAHGDMMRVALDFSVTSGASFSNPVDLDTGATRLSYTLETKNGAVEIPKVFTIEIPVFQGIEVTTYKIDARFRYKMREGGVDIRYELVRPHKVVEQAFKDELQLIRDQTKALVLFGEP